MARQYYKDSQTGNMIPLGVKVEDTLPIGTEVDYDGTDIPEGWEEVDDPNVYSTTETRVGTWIDNKPIYRKVFTFTTPSDGTATNVANITDLHIDNLINDFFSIKYTGNITTSSNNSNAIMFIRLNYGGSNDFLVMSILNSTYYSKDAFAIIEYTKTTDV